MNASSVKTLLLGAWVDLPLAAAQPFFLSLERAGYRGEVALVCGEIGAAARAFLRVRTYAVELLPYRRASAAWWWRANWPPGWVRARRQQMLAGPLAAALLHPNCARHFFYRNFLEVHGAKYDRVMLTDVRDVLFQRDPFDFALPDGLSVFLEDARWRIRDCGHTARQLERYFGAAILARLAGERVACAGTIIGSRATVGAHLERVTETLARRVTRKTVDQGLFNYLLCTAPPARVQRFENFFGPVLNMARLDEARLRMDAAGRLLDAAGRVINTLHQYDRCPARVEKLLRELRLA